jgi:hypothetical protein
LFGSKLLIIFLRKNAYSIGSKLLLNSFWVFDKQTVLLIEVQGCIAKTILIENILCYDMYNKIIIMLRYMRHTGVGPCDLFGSKLFFESILHILKKSSYENTNFSIKKSSYQYCIFFESIDAMNNLTLKFLIVSQMYIQSFFNKYA